MSDDRKLNIINEHDEIIGEATRETIHKQGLLHREVHVWFYTPKSEIIFQHRAKDKDTYPDLLDATVGGHVEIGDDYEQTALKEMEEETGVNASKDDLVFIQTTQRKTHDQITGKINNVIRAIYAYCYTGKLDDLKIEQGKAIGFEVWPLEKLFNISEDNAKHFIDTVLSEDEGLPIFRKISELLK